jgi:hypothetical protein
MENVNKQLAQTYFNFEQFRLTQVGKTKMGSNIKRKSGKTPSYFSHEFIIQNHGDIVTCVVMVFIVGLMFQVTHPLASSFVVPKYNLSEPEPTKSISSVLYSYGFKDIALVLFYSLAVIILHAVIQEYVLDVSTWPRLKSASS